MGKRYSRRSRKKRLEELRARQEEERKRMEEERTKREEEEKIRKAKEEAKEAERLAKLEKQAEIKRQKELEIERKLEEESGKTSERPQNINWRMKRTNDNSWRNMKDDHSKDISDRRDHGGIDRKYEKSHVSSGSWHENRDSRRSEFPRSRDSRDDRDRIQERRGFHPEESRTFENWRNISNTSKETQKEASVRESEKNENSTEGTSAATEDKQTGNQLNEDAGGWSKVPNRR